jgi:hypothetical protein
MTSYNKLHTTITNVLANEFMEFIDKNPDKPWDWSGISGNPNLTMEFIDKNPDKIWNWSAITRNSMNYNERYIKEARRQLAALRIQLHWLQSIGCIWL